VPEDGRNYRLSHALAQRHGFIEESAVVGGVLGPLATGSAQGFRDLYKRRDIKMTIEITGCAASHDDNANVGVARESVQRFGERLRNTRSRASSLTLIFSILSIIVTVSSHSFGFAKSD
jgi:hypothetical protein